MGSGVPAADIDTPHREPQKERGGIDLDLATFFVSRPHVIVKNG
jgi:hypothetical protein